MTGKRKNGKGTMMNVPSVLKLIVALFFLATIPLQVHALTPAQVFDKVKDSIVVVKTLDAPQGKVKGQGSGVLLPSGKIATNCHVVEVGASYQVGRGKQLLRATLFAEDMDKDVCLLDAKGIKGKPAQIGKAASLKEGDPVYAVGAPQGLELSLSDGIVAQLRGGPPPLIQTTAAISPGSSGGGLFDREGRLVGLTTLYIEGGQSLNFAMPVEWIGEIKPSQEKISGGRSKTEWLKRAIALDQLKDWQGMLGWCREWTVTEPTNDVAWVWLGFAYFNLKRFNEAIEAFSQAPRINPKNADAWSAIGAVYVQLNRYNDAIEAYRQVLGIKPEDVKTLFYLGVAYGELKRYNDAIEAYRKALRVNPEYAEAWYNLGSIYVKIGRRNETIEAFRQFLRINSEDATAWYNIGRAYGDLSLYLDAIEAYRQALRINPAYVEVWYNLGIVLALTGSRPAALDAVRELRRLDPEKADRLFNLIGPR